MTTRLRLLHVLALALASALAVQGCRSARTQPDTPTTAAEVRFGVSMAQKGLWSEAIFRFHEAQRLSGGNDPQVLNNLAVASEALGKFDDALGFYKQALQLAPGDPALKNNYDRFLSFYESFRARGDEKGPKAPAAPAADNGTASAAHHPSPPPGASPEPPGGHGPGSNPPPVGAGPGTEPLGPQPLPTPPQPF
jgi:Tfp pilus assembly protein PilF